MASSVAGSSSLSLSTEHAATFNFVADERAPISDGDIQTMAEDVGTQDVAVRPSNRVASPFNTTSNNLFCDHFEIEAVDPNADGATLVRAPPTHPPCPQGSLPCRVRAPSFRHCLVLSPHLCVQKYD